MTSTETRPSVTRSVPTWWRALAIFLALALLLGWAASASMVEQLKAQIQHAQTKLQALPQIRHLAVLLDDQQKPAMLVTFEAQQSQLQIQRLNEVKEGREDTMQLWAIEANKPARSLGVVTSKFKTMQWPLAQAALNGATELAISVEAKGGVPEAAGPRLPYLFKGWLVQKAL